MLSITLNGSPHPLLHPTTLAALVESLQLEPAKIAIEINRSIIPRSRWAEQRVNEGDVMEVIQFVGGG
jgi:thiazole synthase